MGSTSDASKMIGFAGSPSGYNNSGDRGHWFGNDWFFRAANFWWIGFRGLWGLVGSGSGRVFWVAVDRWFQVIMVTVG